MGWLHKTLAAGDMYAGLEDVSGSSSKRRPATEGDSILKQNDLTTLKTDAE